MTDLRQRIEAVLSRYVEIPPRGRTITDDVMAVLQPDTGPSTTLLRVRQLEGELAATKLLLAATQEQHHRTVADFCALRDALPREQVQQILEAVSYD